MQTTEVYDQSIRRLSRQLRPIPNEIDALGLDQSDYEADLRTHAWGINSEQSEAYVHKALWNRTRSWQRAYRANQQYTGIIVPLEEWHDKAMSVPVGSHERRILARQQLAVLRARLTKSQWGLIERIVDAGSVRAAHDRERDGHFTTFQRRVARLRKQMRSILQEKDASTIDSRAS